MPAAYRPAAALVRDEYRHVYELSVEAQPDGSRSFHEGRLVRHHGLNILQLRGDYVEMAFQHGRLLAEQIPQGAVPQSAKLVGDAIANVLWTRRKLEDRAFVGMQRLLTRRLFAAAGRRIAKVFGGDQTLPELIALCDGAGIAIHEAIQGIYNPELLLILAKYQGSRSPTGGPQAAVIPPTCCSSFAAWGSMTSGGELLVGRNLDYPLNGYFDRFPTVIYFEPPAPALRYMSFVSAGVHSAGITAYNEAGIFLASHVVPSDEIALRGVPAIVAADQIIRRATTLDEAADLFRQLPPPAGWSYLVASTSEGKIASVEMSSGHFAVRPAEGDCHVQTNHYLTRELRDLNLFLNASVDEDSLGRAERITQRLDGARGRLDANEVASILGDQVDSQINEVRGLGNTVGCETTLGSLVVDPAHGRVLVSTGPAPACHSEFVELPLVGTFARGEFPTLSGRVAYADSFGREHPEKLAALKLFIEAKTAYEMHNDAARAYELMKQVVWNDASNPAYYFQLGIFALKNAQYDEGLDALDGVFHTPYLTAQLRRLTHYYIGRTLAHLKKANEALGHFQSVLGDPGTDKKLRIATRRAARRTKIFGRYTLGKRSLNIMMQQSDMLYY
jgi:Acyl-coenzyme A:6-aminopenicillanic acid acyl-transferase